jgi:hypothetical protein
MLQGVARVRIHGIVDLFDIDPARAPSKACSREAHMMSTGTNPPQNEAVAVEVEPLA